MLRKAETILISRATDHTTVLFSVTRMLAEQAACYVTLRECNAAARLLERLGVHKNI